MNTIEFANMDFITSASKSYDNKIPFYIHLINSGLTKKLASHLINFYSLCKEQVDVNDNINLYKYDSRYNKKILTMALQKLELDEKYDSMMATLVTV